MYHRLTRRPWRHILTLSLICLVALAIVLTANFRLASAASGVPQPRGAALAAQANHQLVNILATLSFANETLHWTQTVSSYVLNGPDPMNGVPEYGEIWVQVGADGLPVLIHTVYKKADGTLLQEHIITRTTETTTFGSIYATQGCTTTAYTSSAEDLRSALPTFVNSSLLPAAGYQQQALSKNLPAFPTTTTPKGITPTQVYGSTSVAQMWQFKNAYSATRLDTQTLSLGTDNRLLISDVQLFDQTGAQLQKNDTTYGPLQVYPEGVVASTTFSLAGTGQTVCQ